MRVLEQSGTMGDIPKTARADHVVVDQSKVAEFLATSATHGSGRGTRERPEGVLARQ